MASESKKIEINKKGYMIVDDILNSDEISLLKKAIIKRVRKIVFDEQNIELESKNPEYWMPLLSDPKKREEEIGDDKNKIFINGNTRKPIVSKSTGMSDQHYIPEMLELIAYNKKLYKLASQLYQTKYLVHKAGPERFSMKVSGTTAMAKHIDSNLFDSSVNYKERYQSLVTISRDQEIKTSDSGTIALLVYFHHYYYFARRLFGEDGLYPMENPSKSRFFVLPKNWDREYLPFLQSHINAYCDFYHKNIKTGKRKTDKFYRKIKKEGISVPRKKYQLKWEYIDLKEGSVFFWHQYIPHFNCRNKSSIPRIACYYSLFPVEQGFYQTEEYQWVKSQYRECRFSYGVNYNNFPKTIHNKMEMEYIEKHNLKEKIQSIINRSSLTRKLSCQKKWF